MDLYEIKLPAPIVLNNYVHGLPKYSYEDYLLEFVNLSDEFKKLSNGKIYHSPASEAHSECDCISSNYSIDFKMIETSSYFNGLRNYSFQYSKFADGCISTYSARKKGSTRMYLLMKCLRGKSLNHLNNIYESKNKKELSEDDKQILNYLHVLTTNKNLLLFYPHVFYYKDSGCCIEEDIAKAISSDIKVSIKFRKNRVHKDTYLCTFIKNKFLLLKENKDEFSYIESIETNKSKKFMKYLQIETFFEIWFKDLDLKTE